MLVGKKLRGGSNSESVAADKAYNIRNKRESSTTSSLAS